MVLLFINNINATKTLNIIGLPPGTFITLLFNNDSYQPHNFSITSWNTSLTLNSLITNYQYYGNDEGIVSGSQIIYHGTTYTPNLSGKCVYNQIINTNNSSSCLSFYSYFNMSNWNTQQANELEQAGVPTNSPIIIALVKNITINTIYNGSKSAGTINHFATYSNSINGANINFINQTIQPYPDIACININLASTPFCANATTPDIIHVPIINGHYGINGGTTYPLIIKFKAKLFGSQTSPFNYSVKDITTNSMLTPLTTITTNSLNATQTFNIPVQDSVEITAGNGGNANYSKQYIDPLTLPTNILEYLPITFTNYQSTAVSANTPLAIGTTTAGNIIGFNAIAYQQYETCNLNNAEFFLANGTVLNSWMEGNILNEQTANASCSSDNSANALVNSANVLYWVKIPTNTFLPADTGTATTNTLYLGWAGNVISTTNTLLTNGAGAGEAPQLSSSYGQFDNGNNVFSYYTNFAGNTLPTGWAIFGSGGSVVVNNGITLTQSTLDYNEGLSYQSTTINPQNTILDWFGYSYEAGGATYALFEANTVSDANPFISSYRIGSQLPAGYYVLTTNASSSISVNLTKSGSNTNNQIFSLWASNSAVFGSYKYETPISDSNGFIAQNAVYTGIEAYSSPTNSIYAQYIRTRTTPPNSVYPTTTFSSVIYPLIANAITPVNSIIDNGQSITLTANPSGGTTPYSYQWYSGSLLTCSSDTAISGATSSTYSANPTANTYYCYKVIDSEITPASATSGTDLITVNPTLSIPSITATNSILDSGQSTTLNSIWSGGTPDYTAKLYSSTTSTCNTGSTLIQTLSSLTSGSATFVSAGFTMTLLLIELVVSGVVALSFTNIQ